MTLQARVFVHTLPRPPPRRNKKGLTRTLSRPGKPLPEADCRKVARVSVAQRSLKPKQGPGRIPGGFDSSTFRPANLDHIHPKGYNILLDLCERISRLQSLRARRLTSRQRGLRGTGRGAMRLHSCHSR